MAITKLTTPELLDFPKDSTSSANTSGTVIPTGTTAVIVDYLVVAGGGAGGSYIAGGGGAGGLRTSYGNTSGGGSPAESSLTLNVATNYTITIGAGGSTASPYGNNGDDSIFATITSTGGGGGGGRLGLEGGSGGGSQYGDGYATGYGNDIRIAGIKNQGYSGSGGDTSGSTYGGGGGGAGGPGTVGTGACTSQQGGGPGLNVSITGVAITYASGGDGGGNDGTPCTVNGGSNTGDGGSGSNQGTGAGSGGSGIIVLRVASTVTATFSAGVTFTLTQVGGGTWTSGDKIYTITDTTPASQTVSFTTTTSTIRPTTNLDTGEFRYNTALGFVEYYDGTNWYKIADEYISGQPTSCICNYPTQALALYEFQDNSSDTCGFYSGIPTNITYGTGKYGKAAVFNGTSSKVSVNSVNQNFGAEDLAVSMWLLTDAMVSTQWYAAFNQDDYADGTNGLGMSIWVRDYKIEIFIRDGAGNSPQMSSAATVAIGSWHHVVLTRQYGVKWELYLDGLLAATDTTANILTANYQQSPTISYEGSNIGRSSYTPAISGAYWWDGKIDQTRFYNSYLSATQVSELYNEIGCN